MRHVEMPMNLLEAAVLVPEVAPLTVRTELLPIELPAILRLVLVIKIHLCLLIKILLVVITELFLAVGVLTLGAVAAEPSFRPVLAHVTLVHGPLYEAFRRKIHASVRCCPITTTRKFLRYESCCDVWTVLKAE